MQLPPAVKKLIKTDTYAFKTLNWHNRIKPNPNRNEIKALREFTQNQEIIIKPADKGSEVVIMDRNQYVWKANRQLAKTEHYKSLNKPIFPDTIAMIKKIVDIIWIPCPTNMLVTLKTRRISVIK